jgi:3-deoxy-D-manno-octulosonate 8-phosphate phosphatase (KDO 8-P phosphatase)
MAKKISSSKLKHIKLLLLDVDGVMTDGGIYLSNSGDEFKKFNTQDGYGIMKLQQAGIKVGIITGRVSKIVEKRAKELGITEVHQNFENKLKVYESIKQKLNLTDVNISYIGDDEFDLPVLERVGFSATPADAMPFVKKRVQYVCRRNGGNGAVREIIDLIMESQK